MASKRKIISVFALFILTVISVNAAAQAGNSVPDTLYRVCLEYDAMPEAAKTPLPVCGYMDAAGKIIVPVGKYEGCMDDHFVWFANVFLKEKTDGHGYFVAVDRNGNILFDALWVYEGPDEPVTTIPNGSSFFQNCSIQRKASSILKTNQNSDNVNYVGDGSKQIQQL